MADDGLRSDLAFLNKKIELCGTAHGKCGSVQLKEQASDAQVPDAANVIAPAALAVHPYVLVYLNTGGQSSGWGVALPHAPASDLAPQSLVGKETVG